MEIYRLFGITVIQLIIAVSREFGSGGHAVAQLLSEKYNIPLYDSNLLEDIADQKNLDAQALGKYDEKSKASFFTRSVRGFSTSPEENLAWMQFKYLKGMADEGKSFSEDARRRFSRKILIL